MRLNGTLTIRKLGTWSFFNLATDTKPFFTKYYGQYTTCGDKRNSIDDSHCSFCLADYKSSEEWLQCPICMVWFHNDCFHM